TVFVREDPKFLYILPQYSQFISAIQEKNPVYILLQVPDIDSNLQNKSLVPLIPGYKNEFGTDRLTSTENVKWLHGFIGAKYSNIFDLEYKYYKAEKEMNTIIKSAKRDADHLETKIEQENQPNLHVLILISQPITACGFSVKINITCNKYSTTIFYKNEIARINYSKLVAGAGLVEESAKNSANFALHAACEQIQAQNKHILEVSFDNSWSHIREASQASGEFIYNGNIKGYRKLQIYKNKKGETITINEENYNSSSKQIEHANLIRSIAKITLILIKYNIVLGVAVDRDLNTVYAACIHASDDNYPLIIDKNLYQIYYDIIVEHLFDNHSQCWSKIYWKVGNPDLVLSEPNLVGKSSIQLNALKAFLKGITQLAPHQNLITKMRTSQNESINKIKLNYTDKKQNYPKSYRTRHALAVIYNNNGFLKMLQIL
ncbi:16580_t:CDS:2, partial [Racocetra persica]